MWPRTRGLNVCIVIHWKMLKKYSSQELLHQIGQYLAWNIPRTKRFEFVQINPWGHMWPRTRGLNFCIVIFWEMLKNYSSQELLHQMGYYLAWSIPRTRRFKTVQIKTLGSYMTPPQGLILLHSDIYWEILKQFSSQERLHQMGQYLAWSILGARELKFVQMKSLESKMTQP